MRPSSAPGWGNGNSNRSPAKTKFEISNGNNLPKFDVEKKNIDVKKPDFPVNEKNQIFSRVPQRPSTAGLAGRKTIQKIQFPTNIIQHFPQKSPIITENLHLKENKSARRKTNSFNQLLPSQKSSEKNNITPKISETSTKNNKNNENSRPKIKGKVLSKNLEKGLWLEKDFGCARKFHDFSDEYNLGKEIGKGAYARVRFAEHKVTGQKFAVKIYDKFKLFDSQRRKSVRKEIKLLQKIKHPNIVQFIDAVDTIKNIFFWSWSACGAGRYILI